MLTKSKYKTADIYNGLRKQVLDVDPKKLGIRENAKTQIYGILMETGYKEGVALLVCIADGTVSLYFSNGGGIIGIGQHKSARDLGLKYISLAQDFLHYAKKTNKSDLPKRGYTRFYFLTFNGCYMYEDKENSLGNRQSELSTLFYVAQDIITQARLIDKNSSENFTLKDS